MTHAGARTPAWADEQSLRALAHSYALAVDRRDGGALLDLFVADATVTVTRPGRPPQRYRGHAQLPNLLAPLAGFEATLHTVAAQRIELAAGAATASGEVSGEAHHVRRDGDGEAVDFVLCCRYADSYARGADGGWRFRERHLTVLWSERRAVRLGRARRATNPQE